MLTYREKNTHLECRKPGSVQVCFQVCLSKDNWRQLPPNPVVQITLEAPRPIYIHTCVQNILLLVKGPVVTGSLASHIKLKIHNLHMHAIWNLQSTTDIACAATVSMLALNAPAVQQPGA